MERVIAGPERKGRVMDEQTKHTIAYHESGHALVGHLLPNMPIRCTRSRIISPRPRAGLHPVHPRGGQGPQHAGRDARRAGGVHGRPRRRGDLLRRRHHRRQQRPGARHQDGPRHGHRSTACPPSWARRCSASPTTRCSWAATMGNTQDYSEETARRIDDEVARIMKEAHDRAHRYPQHASRADGPYGQRAARARNRRGRGLRGAAGQQLGRLPGSARATSSPRRRPRRRRRVLATSSLPTRTGTASRAVGCRRRSRVRPCSRPACSSRRLLRTAVSRRFPLRAVSSPRTRRRSKPAWRRAAPSRWAPRDRSRAMRRAFRPGAAGAM